VSDTLFLAVSYLDRYLSLIPVTRNLLQLVGVTCLLLAAKYEEIYAPQVGLAGALVH
jgi:cyclin-A